MQAKTQDKPKEQRSSAQNRAIHKFCRLLADELNEKGLEAKVVMDQNYEIWWTEKMIKRDLWKPLQKVLLNKESTTELETGEVTKIHKMLEKILHEKFPEAELNIPFPSEEERQKEKHYSENN